MGLVEIITCIIGSSGLIGGGYSLYTARVQKKKMQVEITQLLNDEWKKLFDKLKEDTNYKITSFETKIYKLELKDEIKTRAINQFLKCDFAKKGNTCPVSIFMENAYDVLQKRLTSEEIAKLNGEKS